MAIRLTTTAESAAYVKALVYGESGVGKTFLIKTAPKPLIISAEKGLLTLKDQKIPVIEIKTFEDLEDAYTFVTSDKRASRFETICLDSISDIAETVLSEEKEKCGADPRQAYGAYADKLLPMIKKFRDIEGKHVYFTAKLRRMHDDFTGITSYGPSMPGQQLGPQLPYLFDFCFVLRVGQEEDGGKFRFLQTESDIQYTAKARGGRMEPTEEADLTAIFDKALSDEIIEEVVIAKEAEEVIESDEEEIEVEGSFEDTDESLETEEETEEVEEEVSEEVEESEVEEIPDEEVEEEEVEEEDMDSAAEASMGESEEEYEVED